jgi:hypothetical protein
MFDVTRCLNNFKFCLDTRNNEAHPLDLTCLEHLSVRSPTNLPYCNVPSSFEVSFKESFHFKSSTCCMVSWTRYGLVFGQFFEFLTNRSFQKIQRTKDEFILVLWKENSESRNHEFQFFQKPQRNNHFHEKMWLINYQFFDL